MLLHICCSCSWSIVDRLRLHTIYLVVLFALSRKCNSIAMIQVAPAIFPGWIGSGCPASFHASTASGDNTIPTPPLVRLIDVAPCEKNSVLSSSKFWSLSDHVSCVNSMDGVSLNVRSILTMWSFFELDCSLEYPLTFCESMITLGNLGAVMPPVAWG